MSTILCEECGTRILKKAKKCPVCGEIRPQDNTSSNTLIACEACGKDISKNAVSCPQCGEPVNSTAKSDAIEDYVDTSSKSPMTSFILTLLLGPLGLLYSSIVWGIIMIVIAVALVPTGVGPIAVWVLSIIMGHFMTNNYNERLYAQAELIHSR